MKQLIIGFALLCLSSVAFATDPTPTGNWVAYGVRTIDQSNFAASQFQVFQQDGFYKKSDCDAFIVSQQTLAGWNNAKNNNVVQRVDAHCDLVKAFQ